MSAQNKNPLVSQIHSYDPFPEPYTFPAGWDLSELYSEPQPAPVGEKDRPINAQTSNDLGIQASGCPADK